MPKISVIIPVYNVEKYLSQALESVINQTFADLEIVCVNDGSTDNSLKILKEYAQKDERIKIINQENGGYGAACNRALENITGEYFAILEPDDYIEPRMYEELLNLIIDNNADIAKCTFSEVFDFCLPIQKSKVNWSENFSLPKNIFSIYEHPEFLYFHPSIWSCLYKTSFVKENNIKFPTPKGAGWADNLFQVKTFCLAKRIIYTDEPYYNYRKYSFSEADVLKDYRIPFERSNEIHEWLVSKNIDDKNLLACLYMREHAYIRIVLDKKYSKKEIDNVVSLIKQMICRMDVNVIESSSFINKKMRKELSEIRTNPHKFYKKIQLKRMRKKFISLRWNRKEKSITVFGKQFEYSNKKKLDVNYLNLCFSCNERYAQHLCCTLKSIFVNKNPDENFNIVILNENIKPRTKHYIERLLPQNSQIRFVEVDDALFKNCPLTGDIFHINSLTTYYRFILPEICNFDKVLYLDCDTIVNKSLSSLYKTNIDNYYIAGVIDSYEKENCERLSLNKYVNAGVLLINLDLWRKDDVTQRLFEWTALNKDIIKWGDQDVLNVVLQKKILYLPDEYNAQVSELEFGKTKEFNRIADKATIIHYVGHKKPWNNFGFSLNKYYFKYFDLLKGRLAWKIPLYKDYFKFCKKKILKLKISKKNTYLIVCGKTLYVKNKDDSNLLT